MASPRKERPVATSAQPLVAQAPTLASQEGCARARPVCCSGTALGCATLRLREFLTQGRDTRDMRSMRYSPADLHHAVYEATVAAAADLQGTDQTLTRSRASPRIHPIWAPSLARTG